MLLQKWSFKSISPLAWLNNLTDNGLTRCRQYAPFYMGSSMKTTKIIYWILFLCCPCVISGKSCDCHNQNNMPCIKTTQSKHKDNIQYIIFAVFMELPTWKGAYCLHRVNPLSVRLFNHARGGKHVDKVTWCCLLFPQLI